MKKILVVGYSHFQKGFNYIFDNNSNFEFIEKEHSWDKMSDCQRISYASRFDIIHYFWSKITLSEFFLLKLRKFNIKIIFHFIGSDVILISKKKRRILEYRLYQLLGAKFFADHQNLVDELKYIGINAGLLPFVNDILKDNEQPLPETFSVIAYVPKRKEKFYNLNIIEEAAKKLTDINFTIFRNDIKFSLPNIISVAYVDDIFDELNKHNVFIRLTEHDGLPSTLLEALSCARHVIWSFEHKYCHQAKNLDELVNILITLQKENLLNKKGKEFVLNNYSMESIRGKYYAIWGKN